MTPVHRRGFGASLAERSGGRFAFVPARSGHLERWKRLAGSSRMLPLPAAGPVANCGSKAIPKLIQSGAIVRALAKDIAEQV